MSGLSIWSVIRSSLRFFWKTHFAIALGVAAATAVIVGALVVGDSVRGSLRGLVLDRLANIECLLHAQNFFEASNLPSADIVDADQDLSVIPAILLTSSTVERRTTNPIENSSRSATASDLGSTEESVLRASRVQVLAVANDFWNHVQADTPVPLQLNENEIAINASLAAELSADLGDELTLRFSSIAGVPADNPLASRDDATTNLPRQKVVLILPDSGIGSLSFQSTQSVAKNVFCSLLTLQDALECGTRINAALVLSDAPQRRVSDLSQTWCQELSAPIHPRLEDYGLELERVTRVFPDPQVDDGTAAGDPQTIYDYYQLTSQELVIDNESSLAIVEQVGAERSTRLISYLANFIWKTSPLPSDIALRARAFAEDGSSPGGITAANMLSVEMQSLPSPGLPRSADVPAVLSRKVPYSMLVGVEENSRLQLQDYIQAPKDTIRIPYCWINEWLAKELDVVPGDWVLVQYFEPETIDGAEVEREDKFQVAGIVPLTSPVEGFRRSRSAKYAESPTVFNDPNLTPSVKGLTDKDSIANWDAPFKLETEFILETDDDFYRDHRLTPKLYLPYRQAASPRLFGSRFGQTTAIRVQAEKVDDLEELRRSIENALLATREARGIVFLPVRNNLLVAASGTTPFDMLFLSLSFFVIVAALLLVTLLFKLGLQQRSSQLGILAAQGFTVPRIRSLLLRELTLVSMVGALLGIALGIVYARAMIAGLQSWWLGAIASPFLEFSVGWPSLVGGALAGWLVSLATMVFVLRKLGSIHPLTLLRGQTDLSVGPSRSGNHIALVVSGVAAVLAAGLIFLAIGQSGMARAGSFFGSGMLLLVAAMLFLHQLVQKNVSLDALSITRRNLAGLAWQAISRNPLRSTLTVGLLSVATFMIASMSVFQVSPDPSGYGGYDLLAESSQPIYDNIASYSVEKEVLGAEAEGLRGSSIISMRARPGEDASCNNLFQVAQPMVLGVPPRLGERFEFSPSTIGFSWAAAEDSDNPWYALRKRASGAVDDPIPVVLDQNTAAWSLKQGASLGAVTTLTFGEQTLHFRTVGLLSNSVLQGKLMIGESNFKQVFPEISGYQFFLIRSGQSNDPQAVARLLEKGWSTEGLDVTSSQAILERLLGVQNTYISAFQSLGALGLLLGTLGLVAVQLRSVLERRSELALMQAVGFSQTRIASMLTLETAFLLGSGLLIGFCCAAIALVPYIIETQPQLATLTPLLMICVVVLAGFVAALLAVREATKTSVLEGLRSE